MGSAAVWNRWFWRILCVALLLRLGAAIAIQTIVSADPGRLCLIAGDAEGYWELAGKIAAGEPYSIYQPPRRLLRMPGFPALLAVPRLLFGDNPFAARLGLAAVGTLACACTCWLGRILVGETASLLAGAYAALSPSLILFSVLMLSETAFAATMLASLIAAAWLVRPPVDPNGSMIIQRWWLATVTGLLVGLATYMRPTWILVGPGIGLCLILLGPGSIAVRCALAACLCGGLALTLAPWTVRNYRLTGHPIPTTLWVGPSLYDGLNPTATGDSNMQFFEDDRLLDHLSEYEMDREYRRRSWQFAAAHPGRVVWLAWIKQLRYWSPAPNGAEFDRPLFKIVGWAAYLPLYGFAMAGAWFARRSPWLLILTAAPVLYFAALHLLFVGSLRYRLPAEYPLAVLAAHGICQFGRGRPIAIKGME